jgi:hypothetical protein
MYLRTILVLSMLCLSFRSAVPAENLVVPPGVTELKFSELMSPGPIGDRGLCLSEKVKSLNGKKVQMVGHMVRQENSIPGIFLLTAIPVQLNDEHYGLADDLPAGTIFVSAPSKVKGVIPYKAGPLLVTGMLSVGNREAADGRISIFRIELDAPPTNEKAPLQNTTKTAQGAPLR